MQPGERVGHPAALLLHQHDLAGCVQPRPPTSSGMLVAVRPSSSARVGQLGLDTVGELAVVRLGVLLVGDQLVGELPGAGLQVEVGLAESVHPAPLC